MQFQDRSDYGLLQIEVGYCSSRKDPPSEDSRCERSQGLKGNLSLGCYFLHLYNSLLRHIPASFISASPDCRFVPTPAGSMQWRLWLKGCQRNMTRSLFPSLQPWFIDYHWFNTRATPGFLTFCHNQISIVLHWSTLKRHFLRGSKQWIMCSTALSSVWDNWLF